MKDLLDMLTDIIEMVESHDDSFQSMEVILEYLQNAKEELEIMSE